jgi:hypothetical protein
MAEKCPRCGRSVDDAVGACPNCGTDLVQREGIAERGKPPSSNGPAYRIVGEAEPAEKTAGLVGSGRAWYYSLKGIVYGPASSSDIRARIADGRLPSVVELWTRGFRDWAPATDYVAFSDVHSAGDDSDNWVDGGMGDTESSPPMVSVDRKTKYARSSGPDTTLPRTYNLVPTETAPQSHNWVTVVLAGIAILAGWLMDKSLIGGLLYYGGATTLLFAVYRELPDSGCSKWLALGGIFVILSLLTGFRLSH